MNKSVLIVEDDPLILRSLKKIVERDGHTVTTANKGNDAIQLIMDKDFDKIITDLMLEDITGFEVIEESKKRYDLDTISEKFIIITAYSSMETLEKAHKYKCKIIPKPFKNVFEIVDIIRN